MERVALDTSFLIDLQNEKRGRGSSRGASQFLRANPKCELLLPAIALGEYLEGFENPDSPAARDLIQNLIVLPVSVQVSELYARVARELRASGQMIGANDLWIGCIAKNEGLPLASRNVEHFKRIPGLQVVDYAH